MSALDVDLEPIDKPPIWDITSTNDDGGLMQTTLEAVDDSRLRGFFVKVVPILKYLLECLHDATLWIKPNIYHSFIINIYYKKIVKCTNSSKLESEAP